MNPFLLSVLIAIGVILYILIAVIIGNIIYAIEQKKSEYHSADEVLATFAGIFWPLLWIVPIGIFIFTILTKFGDKIQDLTEKKFL